MWVTTADVLVCLFCQEYQDSWETIYKLWKCYFHFSTRRWWFCFKCKMCFKPERDKMEDVTFYIILLLRRTHENLCWFCWWSYSPFSSLAYLLSHSLGPLELKMLWIFHFIIPFWDTLVPKIKVSFYHWRLCLKVIHRGHDCSRFNVIFFLV